MIKPAQYNDSFANITLISILLVNRELPLVLTDVQWNLTNPKAENPNIYIITYWILHKHLFPI